MSYTDMGYTPGWCGQCGRRLGRDGRCSNCDPWWTSPIMYYAGGLTVLVTFVVLGIITLSHSQTPFSNFGSNAGAPSSVAGSNSAPSSASYDDPSVLGVSRVSPSSPAPAMPATVMASAPMLPAAFFSASGGVVRGSSSVSEDEARFNDLVRLREMTAYVDSVVGQRYSERRFGMRQSDGRMVNRTLTSQVDEGK